MTDRNEDLYGSLVRAYWRVNDEAWPLGEESEPAYLNEIGLIRNYGGQV